MRLGAEYSAPHSLLDFGLARRSPITASETVFIDPGSPWQNAWIESFNSRLRDELLNLWQFDSLLEAQVIIEGWRIDYNNHRPHSAHGDLTPTEYAQAWTTNQQPDPHNTLACPPFVGPGLWESGGG